MRMFAVLFASLFLSAVAGGQSTGGTWITNVTIVSPEALNHVVKGSVLIEGGRIVRVERKQNLKAPAGAKVVNGDGGFLIPGLIDSHVHLASIPGMGFDQRVGECGDGEQLLQATSAFVSLLWIYDGGGSDGGGSSDAEGFSRRAAASG